MFIAHESAHDCPGEGCQACLNLHGCLSFLRGILLAAVLFCALLSAAKKDYPPCLWARNISGAITPITLKVKLIS
jgi:hypothetical protein